MGGCDGAYYDLLDVARDASVADIKRAFRRRALVVHPDRNPGADAHAAFQRLRQVHDVLVDEDRRSLYDEGGEAAVDGTGDSGTDAAFWANASASLTPDDIVEYEKKYPASTDERDDLKEHYQRFSGRVDKVVDYIPFAEDSALTRFIAVWDSMIEAGELARTGAYERARKGLEKRGKKAATSSEAKKRVAKRRKGEGNETGADAALTALIQGRAAQRAQAFNSWADSLAEQPPRKKTARKTGRNASSSA
jgi:curved DNA-binding protein CbpA